MPKRKSKQVPEVSKKAKKEVKPEAEPEVKPEVKPDVKPEAKPEAKPEVKPEAKPKSKNKKKSKEDLIKDWINTVRYKGNNYLVAEMMITEDAALVSDIRDKCETLWESVAMEKLFTDMWNGIFHGLEDNMDTESLIVENLLRAIDTGDIREKLLDEGEANGYKKEEYWSFAGQHLWAAWTSELKFISI